MKALVIAFVVFATVLAGVPTAEAAPCGYPDVPCCKLGEVPVTWRCVGACDVLELAGLRCFD